jgi:hypothetical protein
MVTFGLKATLSTGPSLYGTKVYHRTKGCHPNSDRLFHEKCLSIATCRREFGIISPVRNAQISKLISSALDVGPASFVASGDQIPLGREKHGDLDNPGNFMIYQTVIV